MNALLTFHRLAAKEYVAARRWYERRQSDLDQRFTGAVDAALRRIAESPDSWTLYGGHYHWFKVKCFPYVIYYHILDPARVLVLAVAHGRRRPGYWKKRSNRP